MDQSRLASNRRAKRVGFLCAVGIFVSYLAIVALSWELALGRADSWLSIGNLGLGHVFLPDSLHVAVLALPPLLVSSLGLRWMGTGDSPSRRDVLAFLQYEVVFPLFFAAVLAFVLGAVSFVGDASLSVDGILALLAVGAFSAASTFAFFLYLELYVVPGALVGSTVYLVVERLV